MRENPVASNIRLRERLVMASESLGQIFLFLSDASNKAELNLETLSGRAIKDVERQFLKSKAQAKRSRVPKAQNSIPGENAEEEDPFKPIPHLPPYATQYRDLLLQELDSKARKNEEGRKRHAPIENGFLSLAKAAERK